MTTTTEKREYPRHTALYDAKYTISSGTYRDAVGNVSASGIFIRTKRPIKADQPISLRFPILAFDSRPIVEGVVVRCAPDGFAVMFDHLQR